MAGDEGCPRTAGAPAASGFPGAGSFTEPAGERDASGTPAEGDCANRLACETSDALRLAAGPAGAATDPAARAVRGTAGEPGPVVAEDDGPVRLLDAVDPPQYAAA